MKVDFVCTECIEWRVKKLDLILLLRCFVVFAELHAEEGVDDDDDDGEKNVFEMCRPEWAAHFPLDTVHES